MTCIAGCEHTYVPTSAMVSTTVPATKELNSYNTIFFPQAVPQGNPQIYPAALIEGVTKVDDGCIRIVDASKNSYLLIWPSNFSYTTDGANVTIYNFEGEVFAQSDKVVEIGGGEISFGVVKQQLQSDLSENCRGPYWLVSPS